MRQYDAEYHRLVYLTGTALPDDWDARWNKPAFENLFVEGRNAWLVSETRRFLPAGSRILEGGCGCADKVHSLSAAGYEAIGFDTATKTLHHALEICPRLNIAVGDIRKFPLADESVDGYWSLGVFEHFQEGMRAQWDEAARVTRPNGFLFLTLPILSPLRRLKAGFRAYPPLGEVPPGRFYQYAYSPQEIVRIAEEHGFTLVRSRLFDGVKGLKDEVPLLRPVLQRLYDSNHILARLTRRVADIISRSFSGHMGYFVFQRTNRPGLRKSN